ncbi:hypothetical protein K491DRAFT_367536 [Lophiostoma macrostomum CBS 122681]|uniref:Uncharacterized protein n=1 Tax=Lophiostoma macrostomum CBS 122681 TaxID=1314788 RepID=A0A6A6T9T7_9PLEO|nr:hypothetical protein K491DRAFT_367536 [Lophiostoma macrostomum CBS 122681]
MTNLRKTNLRRSNLRRTNLRKTSLRKMSLRKTSLRKTDQDANVLFVLQTMYFLIKTWAFRSNAWKECNFAHVNLTDIHRQSDAVFIGILQKLRLGRKLHRQEKDLLLDHESETVNAVQLFGTRAEVKHINDHRFNKLVSTARSYSSFDHCRWNGDKGHDHRARSTDGETLLALKDPKYDPQVQLKKVLPIHWSQGHRFH